MIKLKYDRDTREVFVQTETESVKLDTLFDALFQEFIDAKMAEGYTVHEARLLFSKDNLPADVYVSFLEYMKHVNLALWPENKFKYPWDAE